MKKIFFTASLSIFALLTFAQTETKKDNEPKASIEFETLVHDFGKIYDGRQSEYEFVFTNKGKAPLILSNVQPGCGCTTPEWPREPIMPGQKSKIKAIYNPGNFRGPFSKGITVQSNATNGSQQLTISGAVEDTPKQPQSPVKIDVGGGF
ncbi:MAG: DUF1573 domain-containing protein [bacterium]|nr:DUF1573 domain-containing protein [bacterium]